jgi:predicted nucleotidyltransferase
MDAGRPYTAVCPSLDGEVLMALAATKMAMTGRQVALMTGRRSHSGVLRVLDRLTEHGLVERVELNRAFLFSLNRDHMAYPAVVALVGLRVALLGRIQQELQAWKLNALHVSLFGSFARGDGDTDSDIDLFVVRPAAVAEDDARWRDQLDALTSAIYRWTGNRVSILEASETELTRLTTDRPPIVAELRGDAIVLSGPEVTVLLGEG